MTIALIITIAAFLAIIAILISLGGKRGRCKSPGCIKAAGGWRDGAHCSEHAEWLRNNTTEFT